VKSSDKMTVDYVVNTLYNLQIKNKKILEKSEYSKSLLVWITAYNQVRSKDSLECASVLFVVLHKVTQ
jgi:hypothetical protein